MDGWMDIWMNVLMDGCILDGWIYGQVDVWMDLKIDCRVDG
jgi:hypothetical protein